MIASLNINIQGIHKKVDALFCYLRRNILCRLDLRHHVAFQAVPSSHMKGFVKSIKKQKPQGMKSISVALSFENATVVTGNASVTDTYQNIRFAKNVRSKAS